jgi:hypothetical protein
MTNQKPRQPKPLTVSEYLSAFVLSFLAIMLWRQSVQFALFGSVVGLLAMAFFMAEGLASARTAVWRAILAAWDWLLILLRWERTVKLRYGELALGS